MNSSSNLLVLGATGQVGKLLEDVAEAAAVILMEGPDQHNGKDYWFSADALTPRQMAETLTAATGRKFTAAVQNAGGFTKPCGAARFSIRTSVCQGRIRVVRTGRGRKNGARWKRHRRYQETSRSRAIVAEGLGKATRQRAVGGCGLLTLWQPASLRGLHQRLLSGSCAAFTEHRNRASSDARYHH